MATFSQRLEEALEQCHMKPAELSRLTGIGEGAISQYRKGAYKASQKNLSKIAEAFQEVSGSIPLISTMKTPDFLRNRVFFLLFK